ncbi:HD domain-containing protein [Pseudoalteromonas viridis]|uniref:HD domain-containing protein n=1 Tax=Pseudoalteromonas viridis TaxID=339617 RepID=A0ABX7V7H6_9GAMM|nr:HD domain-containing protein [Pseudoalteromonas viridis]QTL35165.1 HD domain-containing protein [Pseudoalteromonas viridis]
MTINMTEFETACRDFMLTTEFADTAHDLSHILRVVKTAKQLCAAESADLEVVLPAAWLHDCVAVAKNHPDRPIASKLAADRAVAFLSTLDYPKDKLPAVHHAIVAHSFSANVTPDTLEAKVVQDADRMDALGAIGVSRCMKVGGAIARHMYHIDDPFCQNREADDKKYTLDHFYIKLLKIAEQMHTQSAKQEAQRRTEFMHGFLHELGREIGICD